MFMALYRGPADKRAKAPGAFTKGRIYRARPEVDDPSVVTLGRFRVTDDAGADITIDPEGGFFEYPEKGYAVVLKAFGKMRPGEVVIIDDLDGGDFFSVQGMGYVRSGNFQLLDMVLLSPGIIVYERESCRWGRVMRVDDSMRIAQEDGVWKEPTAFMFAVSEGELAMAPFVRCQDTNGAKHLKVGKVYRVNGVSPEGWLLVVDNRGKEDAYPPACFEFV